MKMKMPGMPKGSGRSTKPHARLRKLKPVATTAFPSGAMAFPPQPDPGAGPMGAGGPPMPAAPDPSQMMSAPPGGAATSPAPGDLGQ